MQAKESARSQLARKYRNSSISEEEILQCMYSIGDNNSYLAFSRDPITRMITLLQVSLDTACWCIKLRAHSPCRYT